MVINNFNLLLTLVTIAIVVGVVLGGFAYLTLLERWMAAWMQDRKGPNRVGPLGLFQPLADGVKFLLKEEVVPGHVDRLFYMLGLLHRHHDRLAGHLRGALRPHLHSAPAHGLSRQASHDSQPAVPIWPADPQRGTGVLYADKKYAEQNGEPTYEDKVAAYNDTYQFVIASHVDIGIVFVFAIGSLNVYAIILGGWSSNNKYSMLGSRGPPPRSSATRFRWAWRSSACCCCRGRSTWNGLSTIK